jgi:branched-chain amino acid transport system substrate-binding protein
MSMLDRRKARYMFTVRANHRSAATSFGIASLFIGVAALAQTGVTSDTVFVGQSAGFSGGQAQYSADVKAGLEAYFTAVNLSGGVHGRQIKLVTEDDGGKKDLVLANTKKLNESQQVLALIGYTSGAGVEASLDYISKSEPHTTLTFFIPGQGIATKCSRSSASRPHWDTSASR